MKTILNYCGVFSNRHMLQHRKDQDLLQLTVSVKGRPCFLTFFDCLPEGWFPLGLSVEGVGVLKGSWRVGGVFVLTTFQLSTKVCRFHIVFHCNSDWIAQQSQLGLSIPWLNIISCFKSNESYKTMPIRSRLSFSIRVGNWCDFHQLQETEYSACKTFPSASTLCSERVKDFNLGLSTVGVGGIGSKRFVNDISFIYCTVWKQQITSCDLDDTIW